MSKFKPGDKVVMKSMAWQWDKELYEIHEVIGKLPVPGEVLIVEEVGLSLAKNGLFFTTCKVFMRPFGTKLGLAECSFELYVEQDDPAIKEDIARLLNEATELIRLY